MVTQDQRCYICKPAHRNHFCVRPCRRFTRDNNLRFHFVSKFAYHTQIRCVDRGSRSRPRPYQICTRHDRIKSGVGRRQIQDKCNPALSNYKDNVRTTSRIKPAVIIAAANYNHSDILETKFKVLSVYIHTVTFISSAYLGHFYFMPGVHDLNLSPTTVTSSKLCLPLDRSLIVGYVNCKV